MNAAAASARHRAWAIVEMMHAGDAASARFHALIMGLIVLNVIAVVLGSVDALALRWGRWFDVFEMISVAVFTVEYLMRVWSCTADPRYAHPVWGRVRFALSPMALVDLVAVLPSYLVFLHLDMRVLRALRLVRLVRVAKLGRYSEAATVLMQVLRSKREEMALTFSLLTVLAIIFASLAYFAETDAQPDKFPDIPHALWWAFITITTVGYGDVFPVTPLGKVIGVLTAILGILMIALPTGVFGAAFVDELNRRAKLREHRAVCPHCGKDLDAH